METKIKLTIGALITLTLAIGGMYYVADGDDAYYCESRDIVMICEKLSSGLGTRCYFEETYKKCDEGWIKLELGDEIEPKKKIVEIIKTEYIDNNVPLPAEGLKWECSPEGCVRLE